MDGFHDSGCSVAGRGECVTPDYRHRHGNRLEGRVGRRPWLWPQHAVDGRLGRWSWRRHVKRDEGPDGRLRLRHQDRVEAPGDWWPGRRHALSWWASRRERLRRLAHHRNTSTHGALGSAGAQPARAVPTAGQRTVWTTATNNERAEHELAQKTRGRSGLSRGGYLQQQPSRPEGLARVTKWARLTT